MTKLKPNKSKHLSQGHVAIWWEKEDWVLGFLVLSSELFPLHDLLPLYHGDGRVFAAQWVLVIADGSELSKLGKFPLHLLFRVRR